MIEATNEFYVPGLMDLSKYALERHALDSDWDRLVDASQQGTVFSSSAFLKSIPYRAAAWVCLKQDQVVGGVALIETDDGSSTRIAPHVIYGGPLFAPHPPERVRAMNLSEEFRITSSMLKILSGTYRSLEFQGAPQLVDMRPFLWHNYNSDGSKPILDIRYTSYLSLSARSGTSLDAWPVYLRMSKSRRQAIRQAKDAGYSVDLDIGIETFVSMYRDTFERQGFLVDNEESKLLTNVCSALRSSDRLRLIGVRRPNGELGSVTVWAIDNKRVYYLYGASAAPAVNEQSGTLAVFHAIENFADEGICELDMEGVNSPKRGYFKLSFGGDIRPYYSVRIGY